MNYEDLCMELNRIFYLYITEDESVDFYSFEETFIGFMQNDTLSNKERREQVIRMIATLSNSFAEGFISEENSFNILNFMINVDFFNKKQSKKLDKVVTGDSEIASMIHYDIKCKLLNKQKVRK